jgi:uncharacterized protein
MLTAFFGGIWLGASASLAWSGAQRIAGISGIFARFVLAPLRGGFAAWFLFGLLLTSLVLGRVGGPWTVSSLGARSLGLLAVAGLLVGYGTRLSGGCTSGHGVCGLSRGSVRSIVATLTFMMTAAVVVFLARHTSWAGSP